jgi:hypothetical protein
LSGAEPRELSPFDPGSGSRGGIDGASGVAFDPVRGSLLLQRYDRAEGNKARWQQWDLGQCRPKPIAISDLATDYGWLSSLGGGRWLQVGVESPGAMIYEFGPDGLRALAGPFGPPRGAGGVSPDGSLVTIYGGPKVDSQDHLEGWDVSGSAPARRWSVAAKDCPAGVAPREVRFSGDRRWMATIAQKGPEGPFELHLWRNTGPQPERWAAIPVKSPPHLYRNALSPDGQYLAHTRDDLSGVVVEELTGREPTVVGRFVDDENVGQVRALAFHPDGKRLAASGTRGVAVRDLATGKTVWTWRSPGPVESVAWAADGRHLVTHNGNKTVYVLRLDQFGK